MDEEKIKTYDECDEDVQELLDRFREMKLKADYSKFRYHRLQIENIMHDYEKLRELREDIQVQYFKIYNELLDDDLIEGDVDAALWGIDRERENGTWNAELDILVKIKKDFDDVIEMIESGEAEQNLIDSENNFKL